MFADWVCAPERDEKFTFTYEISAAQGVDSVSVEVQFSDAAGQLIGESLLQEEMNGTARREISVPLPVAMLGDDSPSVFVHLEFVAVTTETIEVQAEPDPTEHCNLVQVGRVVAVVGDQETTSEVRCRGAFSYQAVFFNAGVMSDGRPSETVAVMAALIIPRQLRAPGSTRSDPINRRVVIEEFTVAPGGIEEISIPVEVVAAFATTVVVQLEVSVADSDGNIVTTIADSEPTIIREPCVSAGEQAASSESAGR